MHEVMKWCVSVYACARVGLNYIYPGILQVSRKLVFFVQPCSL